MKRAIILLIALLILTSCISAQALPSPTPSHEYHLTIQPTTGGTGSYSVTDDVYTIVAKPKAGYTFAYWNFVGKYKIIKGNLESPIIKVSLNSDVIAIPYYSKNGEVQKQITEVNTSNISPNTSCEGCAHFYTLAYFMSFGGILILIILYIINRSR